LQAFAIFVGGS